MKKVLIGILITIVVLAILAVVLTGLVLDRAIKAGIETIGPKLTKTDVKVESVRLSLLSGSGEIRGFIVGNPEGYKAPSAISVGSASFAVDPASLFKDKVVIKSINIQAPVITFETDLRANNLKKILSNVQAAAGTSGTEPATPKAATPTQEPKAGKKLEVDEFVISGAKVMVNVTVMGGQSTTATLQDIRLEALGTGPEGITSAELAQRVMTRILEEAANSVGGKLGDIEKGALYMARDVSKPGTNGVDTLTKGLGGLLRKK